MLVMGQLLFLGSMYLTLLPKLPNLMKLSHVTYLAPNTDKCFLLNRVRCVSYRSSPLMTRLCKLASTNM
jgi:hypothetical protein